MFPALLAFPTGLCRKHGARTTDTVRQDFSEPYMDLCTYSIMLTLTVWNVHQGLPFAIRANTMENVGIVPLNEVGLSRQILRSCCMERDHLYAGTWKCSTR